MVFVVTGAAGLVWVLPWLWIMRRKPPAYIAEPEAIAESGSVWRDVLTSRTTWLLLAVRFLTDPVWYFFLFWFPKYLEQVRGLTLTQTGHSAWVVYLAADVGTLAGGWACGPLIRRGMEPLKARRKVMTYAAILLPLSPLAALLPTLNGSLAIASIVALAHMAWLVTLTAIVLDHFPASRMATAAGVIAGGSGLGGMLSAEILGQIIPRHGYTPIFWVMGLLHPLALLLIWRLRAPRETDFVMKELSGVSV
jgi:ACS family hexuronate transporter-like MFS transporter